ncbi:MAG: response regulator [Candidatus Marinimicrobia bacterium]|nr:response regulator [Candidatus Neomarinimicrobiota bacterium]
MNQNIQQKQILIFAQNASDINPIRNHLSQGDDYAITVIHYVTSQSTLPELDTADICMVDMDMEVDEDPIYKWLNGKTNADIIGMCERSQREKAAAEVSNGNLYDYFIFKPIYDIHQIGFGVKRTIEHQDSKVAIQSLMNELETFRNQGLPEKLRTSAQKMQSRLGSDMDKFRDDLMQPQNNDTVEVKDKSRFNSMFEEFKEKKVQGNVEDLTSTLYEDIYSDVEKAQGDFQMKVSGSLLDTSQGPKILVVDDEETVRTSIGKILSANGYQITLADDGEKAYAAAREKQPDLILMDIDMPGLTGIEATGLLKRKRETEDIPIVMMTAIATEDAVIRSQEAGAENYISKPFSARELIRRIEDTLMNLSRV